jgi:hypothetical protein
MEHIDPLAKCRADVQKYGWHCLHVYPSIGEEGVGFSYTIGLNETLSHPDIAIFGLDRSKSHQILGDCVETIRSGGSLPLNVPVPGVLANGIEVTFRPVNPERLDRCFGTALRYYAKKPVEVIVLFWPNKNGQFPWQASSALQEEGLRVI